MRYEATPQPLEKRITVEDFSFPSAYIGAAMIALDAFAHGGEDTDFGDETEERKRIKKNKPFSPY